MSYPRKPKKEKLDPRFYEALKALHAEKFWTDTPNPHQIKVARFNYYWTTGTITIDGGPKVTLKGLKAFIQLLKDDRDGRRRAAPNVHSISSQNTAGMADGNSNDDDDEPTEFKISGLPSDDPQAEVPFVSRRLIIDETPTAAGNLNQAPNDSPF